MSVPWFHESFAYLPGTLLGVLGGTWGALAGVLASKGQGRRLVMTWGWASLAASAAMLAAGVAAWGLGQPYGVWYGLGLAGLIGVIVFGINLPTVARVYRAAEERRMRAKDVRL